MTAVLIVLEALGIAFGVFAVLATALVMCCFVLTTRNELHLEDIPTCDDITQEP